MEARRPDHHTAHYVVHSTGSIGYSFEVRPTLRLLPWAVSPVHYTTLSHHTSQRRLRQVYAKQQSLARGFAAVELAATHLTLPHAFTYARLSQPGGCIDPTESLAVLHAENTSRLTSTYVELLRRYCSSPRDLPAIEPGTSRLQLIGAFAPRFTLSRHPGVSTALARDARS